MSELKSFIRAADLEVGGCTPLIRCGRPHEEILAAVDVLRPDLVVMGSTSHPKLQDRLFGGTASRILRRVPCSLLLIKDQDLFRHDRSEPRAQQSA